VLVTCGVGLLGFGDWDPVSGRSMGRSPEKTLGGSDGSRWRAPVRRCARHRGRHPRAALCQKLYPEVMARRSPFPDVFRGAPPGAIPV